MNMLCHTVMDHLDAGTPLVLVTVMDQKGSAPRAAGARMLVLPDGGIRGTVGGGRYEAEAIAAALALHRTGAGRDDAPRDGAAAALMEYSLRGVTDMDMICGGALSLLLEYLDNTPPVREAFGAGREAERSGEPFAMLVRIARQGKARVSDGLDGSGPLARAGSGTFQEARASRRAWLYERALLAPGSAPPDGELLAGAARLKGDQVRHTFFADAEYLLEPFPRPFRLVLFGGGHVSRQVAQLAVNVGFHVFVTDDRPEFVLASRFPGSVVVPAPSLGEDDNARLLESLRMGPTDGIVIVTRGHSHDRDALVAAVRTDAGYIGMIGSKSKRASVYANLIEHGVSREKLETVHSPIGLAIGAESPAEIAVSIVAELIAWRRAARDAS